MLAANILRLASSLRTCADIPSMPTAPPSWRGGPAMTASTTRPRTITVVDSDAHFKLSAILQLWQYRELVYALTQREIKARYRQSLLRVGWAIVHPLPFMVIFHLAFNRITKM